MSENRVFSLVSKAGEAVDSIFDGAVIYISGSGGGLVEPNAILEALRDRFLKTGTPRDLTIVHSLGIGDAKEKGLECLAHEGLVKRVIGGHWTWSRRMQILASENKIEAFCLPAGVITNLMREIGAGRPGLITETGLKTFVDPRQTGGRVNRKAEESNYQPVELMSIEGREYLRYKPFKVDFSFIRGSVADTYGNISFRHEASNVEAFGAALAAHNSGGNVFAQVKKISDRPTVPARMAQIPGILISKVIECPGQWQTYGAEYDPEISGETEKIEVSKISEFTKKLNAKQIIALRAVKELQEGLAVNFGFGIPALIPELAAQKGIRNFWTTVEQGIHGGTLEEGALFGCAKNPVSIVSSSDQFDFYDGGGNQICFLGMGETDQAGNVNVSKLGPYVVGPGGFINISQSAPKVVFCGTFTTKGLEIEEKNGEIKIVREGEIKKFKTDVGEITFSGNYAQSKKQKVLYITERAVFEWMDGKVWLTEIAPGIDLKRDILDQMEFVPEIGTPVPMKFQ